MKRTYVVRIVNDNLLQNGIADCLRYAGIISIHQSSDPEIIPGGLFDLRPPAGVRNSKKWAEINAERMESFGINAVCAPEWETADEVLARWQEESSKPINPFSGPKWHENSEACPNDSYSCVICGRPVKPGKEAGILRVVDGGARFAKKDEIVDESGDMGFFSIGKTCYKKYKKELAAFLTQEEPDVYTTIDKGEP